MSIIRRHKEAQAAANAASTTTPAAPSANGGKMKAKPHAAYAFINGYFTNELGERFSPKYGIKVKNVDVTTTLERFFEVTTQLDEVELAEFFSSRQFMFEYTALEGDMAKHFSPAKDLTEDEFLKKYEGGMLDAAILRRLYAETQASSDDKVNYVDIVKFSGRVHRKGGNDLVEFKAPSHAIEETEFRSATQLQKALEVMCTFVAGKSYTFTPTNVEYCDKALRKTSSDEDLGI